MHYILKEADLGDVVNMYILTTVFSEQGPSRLQYAAQITGFCSVNRFMQTLLTVLMVDIRIFNTFLNNFK